MESVATVYTIVENGGGGGGAATPQSKAARGLGMRCGAEALDEERKRFLYMHGGSEEETCDDGGDVEADGGGGLEIVSARLRSCCLLVPAAFPVGRSCAFHARFTGINATHVRIAAYQRTHLVTEKDLTSDEIQTGCVRVEVPELNEGTVSFVIMVEGRVVYVVPCCVLPPAAAEDVKGLLEAMVAKTRDSEMGRAEFGADELSLFQWVWNESFVSFLTDVDLLFDWLSNGQGPASLIMDVFMNMLRQCCHYEAWEFGAYMLNKASSCGVTIVSSKTATNNVPLTAQTLKAALCGGDHADQTRTATTTMATTQDHQISSDHGGCAGTDDDDRNSVCFKKGEESPYVCDCSPTASLTSSVTISKSNGHDDDDCSSNIATEN